MVDLQQPSSRSLEFVVDLLEERHLVAAASGEPRADGKTAPEHGVPGHYPPIQDPENQQVIDQPLRDELWVLTAGNIEDELLWKQIMDDFPRKNQKQQIYLDWIGRFTKIIAKDLEQTCLGGFPFLRIF